MTVANQTNRISAVGNAAIGQEVPFSFPYSATSDLKVYSRVTATGAETLLAETTNYTLTAASDTGGTLTTVIAVATTAEIHIIRDTPKTQALDLEAGGSFNAENVEDAFDKTTKLIIENKDSLDRALRAPATDAVALDLELPNSVDRASKNLGFDAEGNATVTDSSGTFTTATAVWGDVITKSPWIDIRAFGAVGDGITDNSPAIQAAHDYGTAFANQGAFGAPVVIYIPPGNFMCHSQIEVDNESVHTMAIIGAGGNTSILKAPTSASGDFTGDAILHVVNDGAPTYIGNLSINSQANLTIEGIWLESATSTQIDKVWFAALDRGVFIDQCAGIKVSDCFSDHCNNLVRTNKSGNNIISNCMSYSSNTSGYYFDGTMTLNDEQTPSVIIVSHCRSSEDGDASGGSEAAVYIDTNVHVIIDGMSINNDLNISWPKYGIRTAAAAERVTVTATTISGAKVAGIYNIQPCHMVVNGGLIYNTGFKDQSTPWATYDIYHTGNGGSLTVCGTRLEGSAGAGIHTQAPYNNIVGVAFHNPVNGGEDGAGAYVNVPDATTGDKALYLDPVHTSFSAKIIGCYFEAVGASTGKTAIYLKNTATPVNNSIQIVGNDATPGDYQYNFASAFSDTAVAQICQFSASDRIKTEPIGTLVDTDATPSVAGVKVWKTNTTGVTITQFDDGVAGEEITIISKGAIVFDTSSASRLIGSSVDITTASGDITLWVCETGGTTSSVWRLKGFVDVSQDNTSTAEGIYGN